MTPPKPAVTIRPAVSSDARGIAVVYLESAEHHARLDPVRYHVPRMETIVARYAEPPRQPGDAPATTLVAECSSEIVGFVDARCERSPDLMHKDVMLCHIVEIAVSGRSRSTGIGAKLLQAAEDWGRRNGAAFAVLEYLAVNTRAADFYRRRMGYTAAATTAVKPL